MKMDYIACQLNIAKLDEVQRIILSYELKQNVGLCGPAGVGKTELVEGLVTLLDKRMHAITCDERMTESGIIAYPVLESNGGTKTGYRNNVLAEALLNGEGFYGDEFDVSFLPMIILSFGNLVNAATGSTGILLNMTGHQKPVLLLSSIISIISLSLSYIMIPQFGAVGSASSVAFSTILLNLLFLIFIYRKFGLLSCYIPFLKSGKKYE